MQGSLVQQEASCGNFISWPLCMCELAYVYLCDRARAFDTGVLVCVRLCVLSVYQMANT